MTNNQKESCRNCLEEFMTEMDKITKNGAVQCIRISDKTDLRKKDQEFTINVYFRATWKKYWLVSH